MRVLVDTNIWRYLVDDDAVEPVYRAAGKSENEVLACPAVAYEVLRFGDRALRDRILKALCRSRWTRLMPEAFSESEELLAEIRRLRPDWLRDSPDRATWHTLRADWSGNAGFWRRLRTTPQLVSEHVALAEGGVLDEAREQYRERGRATREIVTFNSATLTKWTSTFETAPPGWDGSPVETWRAITAQFYSAQLLQRSGAPTTFQEWLLPWIDVERIRENLTSWTQFFLVETELERLPRSWLRWASMMLADTRKASAGSPVDNQIASYLIDADIVVTCDKVFAEIVARLHAEAPVELADVLHPRRDEVSQAMLSLLDERVT